MLTSVLTGRQHPGRLQRARLSVLTRSYQREIGHSTTAVGLLSVPGIVMEGTGCKPAEASSQTGADRFGHALTVKDHHRRSCVCPKTQMAVDSRPPCEYRSHFRLPHHFPTQMHDSHLLACPAHYHYAFVLMTDGHAPMRKGAAMKDILGGDQGNSSCLQA